MIDDSFVNLLKLHFLRAANPLFRPWGNLPASIKTDDIGRSTKGDTSLANPTARRKNKGVRGSQNMNLRL